MCSCRELVAALALLLTSVVAIAQGSAYPGIGRPATAKEVAAWDIDVRPDFKGLPAGQGSVAQGQVVWESRCASCHGVFGESNEVFSPLIGGTTADDVRSGRVARLTDAAYPGRTTLMKLPTLSTLWDYIHRAMPWTAPKSLKPDEVYAVTAFMLNLGGVVGDDFTLSDRNMAATQQRLPNRNGMSTEHALWPGRALAGAAKPDTRASACMQGCGTEPAVRSMLPDFARNAHGNLAEQNRSVGAQHGADTTRPAGAPAALPIAVVTPPPATASPAQALARQHNCLACHGVDNKIVGPALREVARKYAGRADGVAYLMQKIQAGGVGTWGTIAMPSQTLPEADAKAIAQWLAEGARN
jgi:S-disulfanyl-L-cysteine oxidoreductase SoxD